MSHQKKYLQYKMFLLNKDLLYPLLVDNIDLQYKMFLLNYNDIAK